MNTKTEIKNARVFWFAAVVGAVVMWGGAFLTAFLGAPSSATAAPEGTPNACGCYSDSTGACYCGKKTKCGCPGECEPKGCEEKRAKQMEKEIAAETKKATSGNQGAGKSRAKGKEESSSNEGEAEAPKKKAKPLSAGQKKELVKLLDAYLAEHPEGKSQTISEVRRAAGGE